MACCLMAPSHYQCWLTINKVLWHWFQGNVYLNTQDINPQYCVWNLHVWNHSQISQGPMSETDDQLTKLGHPQFDRSIQGSSLPGQASHMMRWFSWGLTSSSQVQWPMRSKVRFWHGQSRPSSRSQRSFIRIWKFPVRWMCVFGDYDGYEDGDDDSDALLCVCVQHVYISTRDYLP